MGKDDKKDDKKNKLKDKDKSKDKNNKKSSDDNVPRGAIISGSTYEIENNEEQSYFDDDFW